MVILLLILFVFTIVIIFTHHTTLKSGIIKKTMHVIPRVQYKEISSLSDILQTDNINYRI